MPELEGLSKMGANVTPYCPAGARPFPRFSAESGKRAISTSGACGPDDRSLIGSGGPNGSLLMAIHERRWLWAKHLGLDTHRLSSERKKSATCTQMDAKGPNPNRIHLMRANVIENDLLT